MGLVLESISGSNALVDLNEKWIKNLDYPLIQIW